MSGDIAPPELLNIPVTPPEVARQAMRTVAMNGTDLADTTTLLQMLGLVETPEAEIADDSARHCTVCARPMYGKRDITRPEGSVRDGAKGMCTTHYQAELRAGRIA